MPVFLPSPEHNPNGPDGGGWNRIAIHGMCMDECALKPKTIATFFDALDTRRAKYGSFGPCTNNGNCNGCKTLVKEIKWKWFGDEILVRVFDDGSPWVMNRPDLGWEEYGRPTTWEHLLSILNVEFRRHKDKFSDGVMMYHVAV